MFIQEANVVTILPRIVLCCCLPYLYISFVDVGCVPAELALHSLDGTCDLELQRAAEMYTTNPRLMALLQDLNARHGGDVFVGVNMKRIHDDFIDDPKAYGFETATERLAAAREVSTGWGSLPWCPASLCADRDAYVFWDAFHFHPTERANRLIVQQFMSGSVDYIAPMNLSTVLAIDLQKQQLRT
jgi:phospholipase/lecithinase/hemolysin